MTHGKQDYTKTTAAKIVAAKIDFDLPVILIDRFDSANFLWTPNGLPIDYDAQMEQGAAYEGDAGLALRTSLAAVAPNEFVEVTRQATTTPTQKVSFSALFRNNAGGWTINNLIFTLYGRYAETMYRASMRYRPNDDAWDYRNEAFGWTEILTGIEQHDETWQRVYFEIDLANMQYIAFETADRRVPLAGMPVWQNPIADDEGLTVAIYISNAALGTRADVSIDNIIIKELGS